MAGWLSRTTSLFQKPLPPPPEPFEVECDCGGKVVGQRAGNYQKPTCPNCSRPVFVLPLNVYPRPLPKPSPKSTSPKKGGESRGTQTSANTVVQDIPALNPTKPASGKKPDAGRATPTAIPAEPELLREPRSPIFTPLRLVAAAILVVSIFTVRGLMNRHRIETAKATVAASADKGMVAIKEGDFATAAKELEKARLAVDLLGRKDQTADDIRRNSREATAIANFAASSLTEFLEETLANARPGQSEPLRMASLDKNAWVLFDATVIPTGEGGNLLTVDSPVFLKSAFVEIEIDSPVIGKFARSTESGENPRVIFAAQLEQVSAPKGEPPKAVLTLNGKTAFLWTSYAAYSAIGYRPHDEESEQQTKGLLERQLEIR
ncbi:MAG: hypothetical protein WCH39_13280 [Schlesneria sp.]